MADKKISFGFSKLKKPTLLPGVSQQKKEEVELIQCLEGQTIKILGQKIEDEKPLVIPLIENTKTSSALAVLRSLKNTLEGTEDEEPTTSDVDTSQPSVSTSNQTLDQKAAQEILNDLKEKQALTGATDNNLVLPIKADELPLDGAKESTLDDYEKIPINNFGLAMLRGMGYKDEVKKPSGKADPTKLDGPMLRPKGMGLGADKMIKAKPLIVEPAQGEELSIKKNACVRLLSGKHKDQYGMIESLDDHAGRLLVKLALGGRKEWFNEFLVQPVSKEEYAKYAKVLNAAKYEEHRIKQEEKLKNIKIEDYNDIHSGNSSKKTSRTDENVQQIYNSDSEPSDNDDNKHSGRNNRTSHEQRRRSTSLDNPRHYADRDDDRARKPSTQQRSDDEVRSYNRKHRTSDDEDRSHTSKSKQKSSRSRHNSNSEDDDVSRKIKHSSRSDHSRRHNGSSDGETSDDDKAKSSSRHKSSKKKSHKKKSKSRRQSRSRSRSSDDDDHHYKKKTKKSKRPRSRSHDRHRR